MLRYQLNPNGSLSFVDQFIRDPSGVGQLNRPNGLVFGPDGNLYITSFHAGPGCVSILFVFTTRLEFKLITSILIGPGVIGVGPMLFYYSGPDGNLFVPIDVLLYDQGNQLPGELRSYDINHNNAETDYTLSGEELVFPHIFDFY